MMSTWAEAIVGTVAMRTKGRSRPSGGRVAGLPPRVAVLAMALASWGVVALGARCLIGLV